MAPYSLSSCRHQTARYRFDKCPLSWGNRNSNGDARRGTSSRPGATGDCPFRPETQEADDCFDRPARPTRDDPFGDDPIAPASPEIGRLGTSATSPKRSRDARRRDDERRPVSTPWEFWLPGSAGRSPDVGPGAHPPDPRGDPAHADGALRKRQCESPPGGSAGANGTRRPPQRRRAAETVNDV